LIISPAEEYNGYYGWLRFEALVEPAFVTVAQTGSIGEAFLQLDSCAVNDDCLILLPRDTYDVGFAGLLLAAVIIRLERWRFTYGRKLTPKRICNFRSEITPELVTWIENEIAKWHRVVEQAVGLYGSTENDSPSR